MNNIKYLFLDFNGTILDDVELCYNLLNMLLDEQKKDRVDFNRYRHIFTFPIRNYYLNAGLDFSIESYESMAVRFIDRYKKGVLECNLYPEVKETFKYLKDKGIKIICLSATEINMLKWQLDYFGILDDFDVILGINDIYAKTKEDVAIRYINESNIDKNSALLIGDTLHDYECAKKMGIKAILNYCGHQDIDILKEANVPLIKELRDIKELL